VDGSVWKVTDLDRLREIEFWRLFARSETNWVPSVILSDQKTRAVQRDPFRWAYERFESELRSADRVAVVGYGFGDYPVNRALARGLLDGTVPVVVIDHRDDVDAFRDHAVGRIVAHADPDDRARLAENLLQRLNVSGEGIPGALNPFG
jgi:hypothetical protein